MRFDSNHDAAKEVCHHRFVSFDHAFHVNSRFEKADSHVKRDYINNVESFRNKTADGWHEKASEAYHSNAAKRLHVRVSLGLQTSRSGRVSNRHIR